MSALERTLPAAVGGLAAIIALAGTAWAQWPSERALPLALGAFASFWLLTRLGGRAVLWGAEGSSAAEHETTTGTPGDRPLADAAHRKGGTEQ